MPLKHLLLILALLLSFSITACGRKAAPEISRSDYEIRNLRAEKKGDLVTLSWSVDPGVIKNRGVKGFFILRSKVFAGDDVCNVCPPEFKIIAQVEAGQAVMARDSAVFSHTERVEPDARSSFRVAFILAGGKKGPESKTVHVLPEIWPSGLKNDRKY